MTASFTRPRALILATATIVAAVSVFAAVQMRGDDAPTQRVAARRAATTTTIEPTTTTEAPTTTTTAAPAPVTTAKPKAPTTTVWPPRPITEQAPVVGGCTWAAHMVAGGIGSGQYTYDQFIVDMTNPAWAGKQGYLKVTTTKPATRSLPYNSLGEAPETKGLETLDGTGHMQLVFALNPYMQGGVFTIEATESEEHNSISAPIGRCDAHAFTVDYNGPEGLPGGTAASGATPRKQLGQ